MDNNACPVNDCAGEMKPTGAKTSHVAGTTSSLGGEIPRTAQRAIWQCDTCEHVEAR